MSERSDRHNRLAGEVVKTLIRPMIEADSKDSDILVVLESVVLGVLLFNEGAFGVSRKVSVETVELLTERVLTRLAEKEHR